LLVAVRVSAGGLGAALVDERETSSRVTSKCSTAVANAARRPGIAPN
jgi:hypothetical protein